MAEQQLVDYIKKAKEAGQTNDQTRSLLTKNGWTQQEVDEAFSAAGSASQPASQPKPQQPIQQQRPQQPAQPQQQKPDTRVQIQRQAEQQQPKPVQQVQTKPQYNFDGNEKTSNAAMTVLKVVIVLLLLMGLGAAGYFVTTQTDLLRNFDFFTAPVVETPETGTPNPEPPPVPSAPVVLSTIKLASILQTYDITKLTVYSFNKNGSSAAFCVPLKVGGKVDCFVNNQKLDNPYNYKPYWIGTSPNGMRTVSLFSDPATKKAFVFENKIEGPKYDGTITVAKFSDDSNSLVYVVAGKDGKSFVVVNGKTGAKHDKIYGWPEFSSDGKYILYGARDGQDLSWVAEPIANMTIKNETGN